MGLKIDTCVQSASVTSWLSDKSSLWKLPRYQDAVTETRGNSSCCTSTPLSRFQVRRVFGSYVVSARRPKSDGRVAKLISHPGER